MSTDFNNSLDTSLQSESKLTQNSGKVARFAYTQQAFDTDTVAGTESYNYNQEQNIPLADSEILQISDTILSKGLRSQASSFTRMGVNHFFGRCSYNINKLASHLKTLFETLISFMREGDNAWSPTAIYEEGDVVYFMSTQNSKPCKRTFICKLDCPSANLPPVYTDGSLINTTYWDEISGRMASLEVGTNGSSGTTVATINGDIDINGDIYQNGTPYETHAEQLYTKKDTIIMREDAVAALPSGTYSGLKVLKYDGTNNCALAVDNTGTARVGDYNPDATPAVDDTQPLLTRDEVNNLTNGAPFVWDSLNKRAVSGSFASSPVVQASSATITGVPIASGYTIKVLFTVALTANNTTDPLVLTYNSTNIAVKASKYGSYVAVKAKEIYENGAYVYKYLQVGTLLELYYDGIDFIIVGNPIVLSSTDYEIYANGLYKWFKFGTTERWTGEFWSDGKPVYYKETAFQSVPISESTVLLTENDVDTVLMSRIVYPLLSGGTGMNWHDNNTYDRCYAYTRVDTNTHIGQTYALIQNTITNLQTPVNVFVKYTKTTDSAGVVPEFKM